MPINPILPADGQYPWGESLRTAIETIVSAANANEAAIPHSPADIGAATAEQGARADTAVQPSALDAYVPETRTIAGKPLTADVALAKGDVGLSAVDNTSDADKPVSTAQQAALSAKADLADLVVLGVIDYDETPPAPGVYLRRPAVAFSGPFDGFAAPYRAHSLRRLLSTYTGPAIKVRRSSDNATQEIGFTSAGDLDTAALLAFAGAGDAFVETFFDQGASGRHFSQATAANQPRIVAAGVLDVVNGKPAMVFDGANDLLASSVAGLFAATTATVAAVLKSNSNAVSNATVFAESRTSSNNGFWRAIRGSSANWNVQATDDAGAALWANTAAGSNLFDLAQHQAMYIEGSGTISTWKDGAPIHAAVAAARAGTTTPVQTTLGAHSGSAPSNFYNGTVQELVAWPAALTADRAEIQTVQKGYWGTP